MMPCKHQNIVRCLGFAIEEEASTRSLSLFFIHELCHGVSLYEYLGHAAGYMLPGEAVKDWIIQIGSGLDYLAHFRRISPLIKSSRVLLTDSMDGNKLLRISNFGDSSILSLEAILSEDRHGHSFVPWMPPEWIGYSPQVTAKSHVWSFGVILWELITGNRPYGNTSPQEVRQHVCQESGNPGIPAEATTVVVSPSPPFRTAFDLVTPF